MPVIRNADTMNFADIEKQINTFAKKANAGTLSIDEMAGGTLTISNGGVYGSLLSTPIINPPQVCMFCSGGNFVHFFSTPFTCHCFLFLFNSPKFCAFFSKESSCSCCVLQSAILGMHSIVSRPAVVGGVVVPRPLMYIALTYDHRIIDGREAVFFLRRIKDTVEDPRRLLLDI